MVHAFDPGTQWALVVSLCVMAGIGLLTFVAVLRRWQQNLYFRYLHGLRTRYRATLAEVLSGSCSQRAWDTLWRLPLRDLELLLDPLFSKRRLPQTHQVILRNLCGELGLIEVWQRRVARQCEQRGWMRRRGRALAIRAEGPRLLLRRAKSIRNLGVLRHEASWPLLVKALDDPSSDIQAVALRALGAIHAPASFPAILDRLHAVALGQRTFPSLPAIEAALVCFDLRSSALLEISLRHPHREIRRIAAETLRVMTRREAARLPDFELTPENLSAEFADLLLEALPRDSSAEVRGSTAEVVALVRDPRVSTVLFELLYDPHWQVRLRAVRGLAGSQLSTDLLLLGIRDCLRDSHGLVRDAAIRTLISLGRMGRQHLYEDFLTSGDSTLRAQIVEAVECTGLLASLVEDYSAGTGGVEALMVEQLASEAAPQGFSGVLGRVNPPIRQKFQERFLPYVHFRMLHQERSPWVAGFHSNLQQVLEFPPVLAA